MLIPNICEKENTKFENSELFLQSDQFTKHCQLITNIKRQLITRGWTVVRGLKTCEEITNLLSYLGELMPQYTGHITHTVKAIVGSENYQYSHSANTIQPHTEAPVYVTPPRYLALHCHKQAQ